MREPMSSTFIDLAGRGELETFGNKLSKVPVNRLSGLGKDEDFRGALKILANIVASEGEPLQRLAALALIGKADSSVQRREPVIEQSAREALRIEPPRLVSHGSSALDFNARRYIAEVLDRAEGEWVGRYAAQALLDEERSDHARLSFARLVFDRSPSLADAFRLIASTASESLHAKPGKKDADLARARRIARLFPALTEAIRLTPIDTGEALDTELRPLVQSLMLRFSAPKIGLEGQEAAASAVREALAFLSTIVRTRFSISTSSETYSPINGIKRWCERQEWPLEAKDAVGRLEQSLLEAIMLQARLGRPPSELVQILISLKGDRPRVEARLKAIAAEPGLEPSVREWLHFGGKSGPRRFSTHHATEAGLRDADPLLAAAAVRGERVRRRLELVADEVVAVIRTHPGLTQEAIKLTQLLNDVRALIGDLSSLLRRRSLHLFGEHGEIIEADPSRQEREDGRVIDTPAVRVRAPGVVRRLATGTEAVVRKVVVEGVQGNEHEQ
jgi:hypothetical protein